MSQRKHRGKKGPPPLRMQMEHAVLSNMRHGISKRGDKLGGVNPYDHVYGDTTADKSLRDTITSFCNFMGKNYPEVKYVRDITPDMAQAYLQANRDNWSQRTMENRMTCLRKLNHLINLTYESAQMEFTKTLIMPTKSEITEAGTDAVRVHCISDTDLADLRADLQGSKSSSRYGPELGIRFGLRACEVVGLKAEEIDLDNRVLHLGNYCKNGRYRDVPIRDKDFEWIRGVKNAVGSGRLVPIKEASYLKFLREHFKSAGISERYKNEKQHALRKYYASERMRELRGPMRLELTDERERDAWNIVKAELGHGENLREKLYLVYVKDVTEGA